MPGKKNFTPLHYCIIKSNYEAFLLMVSKECRPFIDFLAVDENFRTPRHLSLINSPFFKILVKVEKMVLTHEHEGRAKIV